MKVVSAEGEAAITLIMQTVGAHEITVQTLSRSRHPRLPQRALDPLELQRHATLLRLLSIAESYSSGLLTREVETLVDRAQSDAVIALWEGAITQATDSWRAQEQAFSNWLGVKESKIWKSITALAQARNAVAHGLGTLTRRQLAKRQSTITILASVGIAVNADRVVLSEPILRSVADQCRSFVNDLDRAVAARDPRYK